jgi:hypothetical protein
MTDGKQTDGKQPGTWPWEIALLFLYNSCKQGPKMVCNVRYHMATAPQLQLGHPRQRRDRCSILWVATRA